MRIEKHVEIRRFRSEVRDFVADPLNYPQWCSKVKALGASGINRWSVWHNQFPSGLGCW